MSINSTSLIFTHHAQERARRRQISATEIGQVLSRPDQTFPGEKPGTIKFTRTLDGRPMYVVATFLKASQKWLIVSVWVRGEEDPTPLSWQVITFPFRLVYKIIRQLILLVKK